VSEEKKTNVGVDATALTTTSGEPMSRIRALRRWFRTTSKDSRWWSTSPTWSTPLLLSILVVVFVLIMGQLGLGTTTLDALIMLTAVVGVYTYSGVTGILSFGHVAFMAIGGYTVMILTIPPDLKQYALPALPHSLATIEIGPMEALPIAWLAGIISAGVFGLLIWRLGGLVASIASLMFLLIIYSIANGWVGFTGGSEAVGSIPLVLGLMPAFTVSILAIWLTYGFRRTRWARFAEAAREDEPAANATGIHINFVRWMSMTLSGGTMAVAGALYVYSVGLMSPQLFYLPMMFLLLAMMVVGGILSLTGAVVGAIVIQILQQVMLPLDNGGHLFGLSFGGHPGSRLVVLGLIMLLVLTKLPGGIVNGREIQLPRREVRKGNRGATLDES
jgi:branched-chain amino acid transport system permease protein